MKTGAQRSAVEEINRLHEEVTRCAEESEKLLHAALQAAWQAGKLLIKEKEQVRESMGAAWGQWLERYFRGTARTAQNYMALAASVGDLSEVEGLSLRQVYLKLGISTEPKGRGKHVPVPALPAHVRLVNRLLFALDPTELTSGLTDDKREAYRRDLRPLYDRLRPLFES